MTTIKEFVHFFGSLNKLKEILQSESSFKIEKTDKRAKNILYEYFLNEKTCTQIAREHGITATRINQLLKRGLRRLRMLDEKEHAKKSRIFMDISNTTVEEMGLSTRTTKALMNNGFHFLRDITLLTQVEFLNFRNAGQRSLRELQEWLESAGLPRLKMDKVDFCDDIINMCSGRTFTRQEVKKILDFLESRIKTEKAT